MKQAKRRFAGIKLTAAERREFLGAYGPVLSLEKATTAAFRERCSASAAAYAGSRASRLGFCSSFGLTFPEQGHITVDGDATISEAPKRLD